MKRKKKSAAAKAKDFARKYGSEERVGFVRSLPCVCCWRAPSENAHTKSGGVGRKADYTTIVPLCKTHHTLAHTKGMKTVGEMFKVDWELSARLTQARWLVHLLKQAIVDA